MISKTVIVKDSKIGAGTSIWEFPNIYGVQTGDHCKIGSCVEIQETLL
jgi:UDP-3-O-[3-hydroxymyristoyl] glucosamine N-acyltransferase